MMETIRDWQDTKDTALDILHRGPSTMIHDHPGVYGAAVSWTWLSWGCRRVGVRSFLIPWLLVPLLRPLHSTGTARSATLQLLQADSQS